MRRTRSWLRTTLGSIEDDEATLASRQAWRPASSWISKRWLDGGDGGVALTVRLFCAAEMRDGGGVEAFEEVCRRRRLGGALEFVRP